MSLSNTASDLAAIGRELVRAGAPITNLIHQPGGRCRHSREQARAILGHFSRCSPDAAHTVGKTLARLARAHLPLWGQEGECDLCRYFRVLAEMHGVKPSPHV